MPTPPKDPNAPLRLAAQRAARRNRAIQSSLDKHDLDGALRIIAAQNNASAQHWHVIYHVPAENVSIPHFRIGFSTQRDALQYIKSLGDQSEPRTEWYDDGKVGIETAMPGRSGLWWILLEVAGCVAQGCTPEMTAATMQALPQQPYRRGPDTNIQPILRVVASEEDST